MGTYTIYDYEERKGRLLAQVKRDWLEEHPDVREWFADLIQVRLSSPDYATICRTDPSGKEIDLDEWCVEDYA